MDNDNRNMTNEELLKILEGLPEPDSDTLQKLEDEGLLQACGDMRLLAAASRAERTNINTEKLLQDFHRKQQQKKRKRIQLWGIGISAAAAAGLFAVFLISGPSPSRTDNEPLVAYLSDSLAPKKPQLYIKTDRKQNPSSKQSKAQNVWIRPNDNEINYHTTQNLAVNADELPEQHKLTVPHGQTFKITLSDGTEVYMNTDSRLVYPAHFNSETRSVYLEGEAYFHVAKDENRPFYVQTGSMVTEVLGTEFNISSYEDSQPQVTLINGSVKVSNAMAQNAKTLIPGEQATVTANGQITTEKVDVTSYIHWKEGYFYYDNVSLLEIMKEIGRWYNISVVFHNNDAINYKLHFVADRKQDLQHVITLLNRMNKFSISLKKDNRLHIE